MPSQTRSGFQSGAPLGSTLDQVRTLIRGRRFSLQRTAVAYASDNGCRTLTKAISQLSPKYVACEKLWLLSFDYGYTQPTALEYLRKLPNSQVRIFDGQRVVGRPLLKPIQSYHPKVYSITEPARHIFGAVIGSGNLTKAGLSAGVEASGLFMERPIGLFGREFDGWWQRLWAQSADLDDSLLAKYRLARRAAPTKPAAPGTTKDEEKEDAQAVEKEKPPKSPTPTVISATHIWFENWRFPKDGGRSGGNLNGGSRNQADLPLDGSPERFFGFDHVGRRPDEVLGRIKIMTPDGDRAWSDMWVKYSNNQQIRIMLPTQEQGGWDYNETVVVLSRTSDPQVYSIDVFGTGSPDAEWCRRMSVEQNALTTTRSGRKWGLFSV